MSAGGSGKLSVSWSGDQNPVFGLRLSPASGAPPEATDEARSTVEAWVAVGARGGFALPAALPSQSSLELVREARPLDFVLQGKRFDPRAFQVLRNLLDAARGIAEARVEDRTPGSQPRPLELPALTTLTALDRYPGKSEHLGFSIEIGVPGDYRKSRRCLAELGEKSSPETLEKLAAQMAPWSRLVESGGFARPEAPPRKAVSALGGLQVYDEYSVEMTFAVFEASESSWSVLFNMLESFSTTVARVTRVSVD
jgi:hypothetical protein